jgi:hypothetical protein
MNLRTLLLALVLSATSAFAQGYIVPNGVTYYGFGALGGYETHVIQSPVTGDYTGFLLRPLSQTDFRFASFTDEGVRTFLVSSGSPVSLQHILAGSYPELTYPTSNVLEDGFFYLGFYTGYGPWDSHGNYTGIYKDPVFGWAEYENDGGVIHMLDSALEYGGGGIYAGTENIIPVVPEPGFLPLFGLSLLGLWMRKAAC